MKNKRWVQFLIVILTLVSFIPCFAAQTSVKYIYDDLNRLVWEEYDTGKTTVFEYDEVGNRLSRRTVQQNVVISTAGYSSSVFASGTMTFTVQYATGDYTWAIINQQPETFGQIVAQIVGSATGNSVMIQGLQPGTFQVLATRVSGGSSSTGNPITVIRPIIKIAGSGNTYSAFQDAYNAAVNGDTILGPEATFTGNLQANRNISVTVDGGYYTNFTTKTGRSSLQGMIQTFPGSGTLTVKNIALITTPSPVISTPGNTEIIAPSGTMTFTAQNAAGNYTWTIINQQPGTPGQTVAQIVGSATGTSVTVQALQPGTFQVLATPVGGGTSLTSYAISTYPPPTVTATAGTGGTISPSGAVPVIRGRYRTFTVTPNSTDYVISSVTGCGGTLSGNVYTTSAITANCTVTASFARSINLVTPSAGSNGSISPSTPQAIIYGLTTSFTVTPAIGYHIASVSGCEGTLSGNTYTTGAIVADCAVTSSFAINSYTVTPSAGANGSISPSTPQPFNYGSTASFTITPNTGYVISSVTGCGGTLSGNTYTTGAITTDCTVIAAFAAISPVKIVASGSMYPTLQDAYNAAVNGDTILCLEDNLTGNLLANRNISVTVDGGYNPDFTTKIGNTSLKGMVQTFSGSGALTINNFILQN